MHLPNPVLPSLKGLLSLLFRGPLFCRGLEGWLYRLGSLLLDGGLFVDGRFLALGGELQRGGIRSARRRRFRILGAGLALGRFRPELTAFAAPFAALRCCGQQRFAFFQSQGFWLLVLGD